MEIKVIAEDSAYNDLIARYFIKEIPTTIIPNKQDLLEILTDILIGTKDTRYGAIPIPEHLVVVREVIRQAISVGQPIPILVPFGGIKADKSGTIDVAEFVTIVRLANLARCVEYYYKPGIWLNIRIEDINALYLYGSAFRREIEEYSQNLAELVHLINYGETSAGHNIYAMRESYAIKEEDYKSMADTIYQPLLDYILDVYKGNINLGQGAAFEKLTSMGWKGIIPVEQRDFYIDRYMNLYPGKQTLEYLKMVATYLAGSWARHKMKATMAPTSMDVNNFIQINYTQPVPGAPPTMFNNALYYRTLPMKEARTHMPAWRSKGYLKIDPTGKAKAKITHFRDENVLEQLTPAIVYIADKIKLKADYICE